MRWRIVSTATRRHAHVQHPPRLRIAPVALLISSLAFAQPVPPPLPADATLLQVSAHGETTRAPDLAQFSAGVVTQNLDANAAMRANAQRMSAVIAALRQAGVAERDVQTSNISVEPQYREGTNVKPTITGYQVSNTVNVRLHDLAKSAMCSMRWSSRVRTRSMDRASPSTSPMRRWTKRVPTPSSTRKPGPISTQRRLD